MKTTVNIADHLFHEAKKRARAENRTFRDLVEDGLRRVLAETPASTPYRWNNQTFGGQGLQPDIRPGDWDQLSELVYPLEPRSQPGDGDRSGPAPLDMTRRVRPD